MSENPDAFKHWIGPKLLKKMAKAIAGVYPKFDSKAFLSVTPELEALELKPRVRRVRDSLRATLPQEFPHALEILMRSLEGGTLEGFDLWPYTEYVQAYGLEHFDESMQALRELTKRFTSEFAVRPFLKRHPERTLKLLAKWAEDDSEHVRRWVSEGSRPRLPWGERLDLFIENPRLTLPLLERLKDDPSLYVRKSVANHLNDIAKDHPDVVVSTLRGWMKGAEKHPHRAWIRNHALRTLVKQGYQPALELLGVDSNPAIEVRKLALDRKSYRLNDSIEFAFELVSRATREQKLIVDYVVHHVKSNAERTPKVFKLKNLVLKPGQRLSIVKRHSLRAITTRKYYPGLHLIEIQVNGRIFSRAEWTLTRARTASRSR